MRRYQFVAIVHEYDPEFGQIVPNLNELLGEEYHACRADQFRKLPPKLWVGLSQIVHARLTVEALFQSPQTLQGAFEEARRESIDARDALIACEVEWLRGMLKQAAIRSRIRVVRKQ